MITAKDRVYTFLATHQHKQYDARTIADQLCIPGNTVRKALRTLEDERLAEHTLDLNLYGQCVMRWSYTDIGRKDTVSQ